VGNLLKAEFSPGQRGKQLLKGLLRMLAEYENSALNVSETSIPTREQIERLEAAILEMPQLEIKTTHYSAEGLYAREIFIPAGTLLTGKVHKCEHLNIVSKGKIVVWTEDGMKEVCAPFTMVSRPGTKRVGLAVEDTVWTTIHATDIRFEAEPGEEVLLKLEQQLIEPCVPAIEGKETLCLG
jgi:hypothetical protein